MRSLIRIGLGLVFIMLGLAGLVLPFLQGWLFLALGFLLLARDVPFIARLEGRIAFHYPRIGRFLERLRRTFPAIS